MKTVNEIPEEIQEIMSYLAENFSKSMRDPVQDREDSYNDLVVLYLENLSNGKVKDPTNKNHWFKFFKSNLVDKYRRVIKEREIIEKLRARG